MNKQLIEGKVLFARNAAVFSYFSLLVLMVVTTFTATIPEKASLGVIIAAKLLPLLLVLPGILKNNTRSHIWLCFVSLLYFTVYTLETMKDWAIMPLITTLITISVFTSSMMFVHWYKKALAKSLSNQPDETTTKA